MFSLKEIFFQPLKCQPNVNTLHVRRNSGARSHQIYLVSLDGFGVVVEYLPATNEYKTSTISLQDLQCKSLNTVCPESPFLKAFVDIFAIILYYIKYLFK